MLRELKPRGPKLLLVLGLITAMSVASAQNSMPGPLPTPGEQWLSRLGLRIAR